MSKSKTRKRQQKALQRRLKITRKKHSESKRLITERTKHKVEKGSVPLMTMRSVRFEVADRLKAQIVVAREYDNIKLR